MAILTTSNATMNEHPDGSCPFRNRIPRCGVNAATLRQLPISDTADEFEFGGPGRRSQLRLYRSWDLF